MKKSPFPRFLFASLVLAGLLFACKKDGITPETSFIEFTIDGTEYRINSTNSTLEGSHSGQYQTFPGPQHILTMVFQSATNDKVANVTLLLNRPDSLEVKNYPNLSVGGGTQFAAALPDLTIYGLAALDGAGSIELSKVATASGEAFEGTFQFTNLEYKDDQQQTISTGHTLTEGSFRVFLD